MLEGTRHEKVALVISSYVIGFVTAFIAFGVNQLFLSEQVFIETSFSTPVQNSAQQETNERIVSVNLSPDGLSAETTKQSVFLSANRTVLASTVINSGPVAGFHTEIVGAEVSPNGLFVYFCEKREETSQACYPYVYALSDAMLHTLKIDNSATSELSVDHVSSWTQDNVLRLDSALSLDSNKPWILETK